MNKTEDIRRIIEGCIKHNRKSQQELYDRYSRVLMGICLRYSKSTDEAEDILQESFIKIFNKIKDFSFNGSFEGWIKRITVNTALTNYHNTLSHRNHLHLDDYMITEKEYYSFETDFLTSEILYKMLNELPLGYRTVFNLYAIEGYKHHEIGSKLGIDENTSKSQYCRARAILRSKLTPYKLMKTPY